MWINEYLSGRFNGISGAATGEIRAADNGRVAVNSTRDYGALPVIAPAGIAYIPMTGSSTMVVEGSGGAVCLGVIAPVKEGLEPGELMLYSAGGAKLVLKNNGKVLINGKEVG
jgi:hypothetical protein